MSRVPDLLLQMVRHEDRDHLRALHRVGDGADGEAGLLRCRARCASLAQADMHVDAGVVEVQRVRMPLAAVADDRDLAVEEVEVAVTVNGCHRC